MAVAAAAAGYGRWVPLLGGDGPRRAVRAAAYLPLLAVLALLGAAGLVLSAGIVLAILAGTAGRLLLPRWERAWQSRAVTVAGRVLIAVAAAAVLPAFAMSIGQIPAAG